MDLMIFYTLCIIGWQCFEKLKIPSPAILGPIIALCLGNFFGLAVMVPAWLKPVLSLIMGIMLGLRFNLKLKGIFKEVIAVGGWIIIISLVTAKVLTYIGLTKATALFSAMPGGLVELTLMAMSFGAEIFTVALLQSSRLLTTMLIIPMILRSTPNETNNIPKEEKKSNINNKSWFVIILLGMISAYFLGFIKMPAGGLIGPMLAVGVYTKINDIRVQINRSFQKYVQIGVGGLIGLNATRESILGIPEYIIPIICLNLLIVGGGISLGFLLHKMTGWDLKTCLLSTAPAGLTPMVVLSMELNADSNRVVLFQMLRLATVVLFAPIEGQLLLSG